MSNQAENNLNYLIDPMFNKVKRLFVLSFKNEVDRTSYEQCTCQLLRLNTMC